MPLDATKLHPIEVFKASLLAKGLSRKRVNNILACLGKMLRYAHEVELIDVVPRVKLLRIPPQKFDFLSFEELSRLTEAVKSDPARWALVLLGADARLRQGEIIALEWGDVDLVAGVLTVRRSSWKGQVGTPKSGRERKVPLTARLRAARKAQRHLKSELVFCHSDGKPFTPVRNRGGAPLRLQTSGAPDHRLARASTHLLLAPRHAGRGAEGDSGAGRALDPQHDPSVHAPGAERVARSDRSARLWAAGGQCREHDGLK